MYEEFRLTIPGCPRSLIIESKKYNPTTGIPSFLKLAAKSMFGDTADLQKVSYYGTEIAKCCFNAISYLDRLGSSNWRNRSQSNWCCVSAKAFRE